MSKAPIILIAGEAGTGKDTVGEFIADEFGAIGLGQADPMKRFVARIFHFTEDQLWGPSALRNAPEQRTIDDKLGISARFEAEKLRFGYDADEELFQKIVPKDRAGFAVKALDSWFERFIDHNLDNGIPVSPRLVLQTLGTEWGRYVEEDMWSHYAIATCKRLLSGGHAYTRAHGLWKEEQPPFNFAVITDGRFPNEVLNVRYNNCVSIKVERPDLNRTAIAQHGAKNHTSENLNRIPPHFFDAIIVNDDTLDTLKKNVKLAVDHLFEGIKPRIQQSFNGLKRFFPVKS